MAKNDLTSRQAAGLVEEDFKLLPNDDAVADGEHIDHEALAEHGDVILATPSAQASAYMSAEEQNMEIPSEVVGPPSFGSPDPTTNAGKLLPLSQHPLRAEAMPEGHPAAISDEYGEGYHNLSTMPGEGSSTVYTDATEEGEQEVVEVESYDELTVPDLKELAREREIEGYSSMNKAELVKAHDEWDAANGETDEG